MVWNPLKVVFSSFMTIEGILLEGRVSGLNRVIKILYIYMSLTITANIYGIK